jgi:carbon storage regulator
VSPWQLSIGVLLAWVAWMLITNPDGRARNMLVLQRKPGQVITIGDNIRVTVIRVSGDRVRIGIEAPGEVVVLREELVKEVTHVSE